MLRRALVFVPILMLSSAPAFAQAHGEITGTIGWTFSDGVSFSQTFISPFNGGTYNRADPKDSVSFGFGAGFYVNKNAEVEFMWNRQMSKMEISGGTGPTISGDMHIDTYHGNFVYNVGETDQKLRPFFYIGLGATNYGDAAFPQKTVPGTAKFSWALGAGVKAFMSEHAGIRAAVRWVPTYIKTDAAGWWCDPFWGCVPAGNVQYANQFELSGGVVIRFEPEPEPQPLPEPQPSSERR